MSDMTDPEHRAQRLQAKRYAALRRRKGTCASCLHRDRDNLHHGFAHCSGDFRRQHPLCAGDARQPRYALDVDVIKQLKGES